MTAPKSSFPWRRRLTLAVAAVWCGGVSVLLAGLGRDCPVAGTTPNREEMAGWTLRYVVATSMADETVVQCLAALTRQVELREVAITNPATVAGRVLAGAGWRICVKTDEAGPLRLEILNPAHQLAWSGRVDSDELKVPGAQVLDIELLGLVIRGQPAPRVVPIGCAPQL